MKTKTQDNFGDYAYTKGYDFSRNQTVKEVLALIKILERDYKKTEYVSLVNRLKLEIKSLEIKENKR